MSPKKTVVVICTYAPGGMRAVAEQLIDAGVYSPHPVVYLKSHALGGTLSRLRLFAQAWSGLLMRILRNDCALVHVHVSMRGSFWRKSAFVLLAKVFGKPVVLHLHGSMFKVFFAAQPRILQKAIVGIFNLCDHSLVLSESWRAYVTAIGVRNAAILPNFISDPGSVAASPPETPQILFLGEVGQRKGAFELLEAFAKLCRDPSLPHVPRLVCCGNGEIERARQLAEKLGVSAHLCFTGWIGPADKKRYLSQSSIFVLPSHNEGLPMSIIEAMAYALPCVSTTVGGIPEMIEEGINGLLVPPGDVDALAAALKQLLLDADLRERIGRNGRNRYESTYSPAAVLPRARSLILG